MRRLSNAFQNLTALCWTTVRIGEHESTQDIDTVVAPISRLVRG